MMVELSLNDRKRNAKKVKSAWEKLNRGNMKFAKFMKIAIDCGIDPEFFTPTELQQITKYVAEHKHMVGYNYADGDNSNRENGFKNHPQYTLKGRFFQFTVKPLIRKAIYSGHAYWISKYGNDSFVYDDRRLKAVDEFAKKFIDEHMLASQDKTDDKREFMHKLRNIVCGMVKEDMFYASAFWNFINMFVSKFSNGFEMTEAEIYNWEVHHVCENNRVPSR